MATRLWTLLLLLGALVLINAQAKIGFNQVLTHLGNFQTTNGGFRGADGEDTAAATASGLLLSTLYGLKSKINIVEATKFINSLENKDGGYGSATGASSDIESTRHALAALAFAGAKAANPDNTATYIKNQVDRHGLIGGSIRSTALALQSLEFLGVQVQSDVKSGVREALKKESSFGETVTDIYYSVLAASLSGYDIPADKVAKSLIDLQTPQGLFYTDVSQSSVTLESTARAVEALRILGPQYLASVNAAGLRNALRFLPVSIEAAADAHLALALTPAFKDNFLWTTGNNPVIVEGSDARPAILLSAKESGGVPHSGFDVSSTHTFAGQPLTKGRLDWNPDLNAYFGEPLATKGNFGPFESVYTFSTVVPGIGPLSFDIADTKHVGYGIVVTPKATVELSGREAKEGEEVTVGTDFKFGVALSSHTEPALLSGDFAVTFSVLDSSNVVIHKSTVDGSANQEAFSFSYKLTSADIPAGTLTFKFDVASKSGVVHTTSSVNYNLAVALVASNIVFDQKASSYKIGDTVKFTFEPATFADLRTPNALSTKDANGNDATSSRHFFLDIKSPNGNLLNSIPATSTKSSKYSFSFPVEATFASIGVNVLTFRYKPAHGSDVLLQNFDSVNGELFEDVNELKYTVNADLSLVEVSEKPSATDLVYGDSVVYKFKVKDSVSGKHIVGSESAANAYLELQHESKSVAPVNVASVSGKDDQIVANWTINPNAHTGKGVLTLSVIDADGKKIPLKNTVQQTVNIGGEITFDTHTLSTNSLDTTFTTFIVELGLFCKNRPLKDAHLSANVVNNNGVTIATVPVATFDGRYTISYSLPHRLAKSGNYKFEIFREVDRLVATERAQDKVDSLVVVDVAHSAPRFTQLPVKAEFLALVVFGGIVFWLINKRSNLK